MFTSTLAIALLLLYFWYMTASSSYSNATKPTQYALEPPPPPPTQLLKAPVKKFQFLIDSDIVWKEDLPENYSIFNGQFVKQDVCHGKPDGTLVLAPSHDLYEHVQQDKLISQTFKVEPNSSFILQDKNPFYFSCEKGRIHQVHMCPPGQYFQISTCHIIDQCAGQPDGKTLADPYDTHRFFECHREEAISKECPPDQFFVFDKCHDSSIIGLYCYATEQPKILDFKTLVVCREGKITYEVCPPGFRYFDTPECLPEACVGQPNGHRIPLPHRQIGPLSFSPGYMECFNNLVTGTYKCSQEWDSHLSKGDNLTHLPQVFDGETCSIPEFCVNVTSDDPDVVVPVHEFTKHVRNWIHSEIFDRTQGYRCEGSTRKRVAMDPGQIIHPKRFKPESACDGITERAILPNNHNHYYNCKTNTIETCPVNQFFDGRECRNDIPFAFQYNNLQLFQLDSLRDDNWMEPWDYDSNRKIIEPCQDPESVYVQAYHVCAHPECAIYPWITQISFQVALRDGSLCTFDESKRLIQKKLNDENYLYWSQRIADKMDPDEPCTPGQNIQSGHFIFDKTIFATCDDSQPFVFCPSSSTNGIIRVTGKTGKTAWACVPPGMKRIIPPNTTTHFTKHEIKSLFPVSVNVTEVMINGQKVIILPLGHSETNAFKLETLDEPVEVEYQYRVTHPLEVAWPGEVSKFGAGAFLIKAEDFTLKPVKIMRYGIKESVTDFKLI